MPPLRQLPPWLHRLLCQGVSFKENGDYADNDSVLHWGEHLFLGMFSGEVYDGDSKADYQMSYIRDPDSGRLFCRRAFNPIISHGLTYFRFGTNVAGIDISLHRAIVIMKSFYGIDAQNPEHTKEGGLLYDLVTGGVLSRGGSVHDAFACTLVRETRSKMGDNVKRAGKTCDSDHRNGREQRHNNGMDSVVGVAHQQNGVRHEKRKKVRDWLQPLSKARYQGGDITPAEHTPRDVEFLVGFEPYNHSNLLFDEILIEDAILFTTCVTKLLLFTTP